MLTCLESNTVTLSELGAHFAVVKPHKKPTISRIQRAFIQEMTRENLTSLRILHAMTRKFGKTQQELPELRKIQNAVSHYRRTKLGGNDRVRDLAVCVDAAAFSGQEGDRDAFTFTRSTDGFGIPVVGDGSDAKPFVIGVTMKAQLRSADRDLTTFILHIDATFQLAQANYPVIVCGMSDSARKFLLLVLFISSQLEETHYTEAVAALQTMYSKVVGKPMDVRFIIGDPDKAQFNGIKNVFAAVNNYTFLMCFYHVVAKVRLVLKERTHWLHGDRMAEVYREVDDLHFANCEKVFLAMKAKIIADWSSSPELANFKAYMEKQWLNVTLLQLASLHYTVRVRIHEQPVRNIQQSFQARLHPKAHRSMAPVEFEHRRESDKRLLVRSTALLRGGFLWEHTFSRNSISFLVNDAGASLVRVLATPALRFYVPSRGQSEETLAVAAQFSVNYARMEIEGQPFARWPVDLETKHSRAAITPKHETVFTYSLLCNFAITSTETDNASWRIGAESVALRKIVT